MPVQNLGSVAEGASAAREVMIIVVVERLPDQVQAVQVMQALEEDRVASAILGVSAAVVLGQACSYGLRVGDEKWPVCVPG